MPSADLPAVTVPVPSDAAPVDGERSATVVITHRVTPDHEAGYEDWLRRIVPVAKSYPGHLGVQVIRPIRGAPPTYTVIIRFDTAEHLHGWTGSPDRQRLIAEVRPLLADDDRFHVLSGLDFWFTPEGTHVRLPTRWKQCLVTWSAIFPLVLGVTLAAIPAMRAIGLGDNLPLRTLLVTGVVIVLMVYVVMPPYTKLVHRWLFR